MDLPPGTCGDEKEVTSAAATWAVPCLFDVRASLVTHVDSQRVKSLPAPLVVWSTVGADGQETWEPNGGNFHRMKT
ncbi:hypothetical protein GCM10018789_14910 [Streptomyces werraensis]|nr:hypothetical protein GCM10018789_14910 [Streptomyces werraensis]